MSTFCLLHNHLEASTSALLGALSCHIKSLATLETSCGVGETLRPHGKEGPTVPASQLSPTLRPLAARFLEWVSHLGHAT